MSENRVKYRAALAEQGERLDQVVDHVRRQLDGGVVAGRGERPAFLGIGASLAAAALPVHLLRSRGVAASRIEAGTVPSSCPPMGDATVAISQSGRSSETVADLEALAPEGGLAVVNVAGSPLTTRCAATLDLGTQPDSKASTTGFTGTLVGLSLLAESWQGAPRAAAPSAWNMVGRTADVVAEETASGVGRLGDLLLNVSSVDVVAESSSTTSAEEGALLLREVCRVAASPHQLRGYLHGPQESVVAGTGTKSTGHLIIGQHKSALDLAAQLVEAGHHVGLLTSASVARDTVWDVPNAVALPIPEADDAMRVVLETVVLQHLSLAVADRAGVDPDEFRYTAGDTKLPATV